jgi:ubiquinone/menaquinone biosynthesis C-methylase UbiE
MAEDKSQFYYGWIYHKVLDPPLEEARQVALNLVPEGSSVLDIGCGTGQLCFALKEQKKCVVVGLDLSLRMIDFARKSNPFQDVTFIHGDANDLGVFSDGSFNYATMLMLMHELPSSQQTLILKEALRVASRGIIIDSVAPLPRNAGGIGIRIVETIFGHDHNQHFKDFVAKGGIKGIWENMRAPINVINRSVFWRNCREVVIVTRS